MASLEANKGRELPWKGPVRRNLRGCLEGIFPALCEILDFFLSGPCTLIKELEEGRHDLKLTSFKDFSAALWRKDGRVVG